MCICNDDYPVSLEMCKVYGILPDAEAASHRLIRVIDESGEDYLYPEDRFVPIDLPRAAMAAVAGKTKRLSKPKRRATSR
jgi:hypothetical protein